MKWFCSLYLCIGIIGLFLFVLALTEAPVWVAKAFCGLAFICSSIACSMLLNNEEKK